MTVINACGVYPYACFRSVMLMINIQELFFMHLFIMVTLGGFAGEYQRCPSNVGILSRNFTKNIIGCMFVSFLAGWAIFEKTGNYAASLISAGAISFQNINTIKKASKGYAVSSLKTALKILEGKRGNDDE